MSRLVADLPTVVPALLPPTLADLQALLDRLRPESHVLFAHPTGCRRCNARPTSSNCP